MTRVYLTYPSNNFFFFDPYPFNTRYIINIIGRANELGLKSHLLTLYLLSFIPVPLHMFCVGDNQLCTLLEFAIFPRRTTSLHNIGGAYLSFRSSVQEKTKIKNDVNYGYWHAAAAAAETQVNGVKRQYYYIVHHARTTLRRGSELLRAAVTQK